MAEMRFTFDGKSVVYDFDRMTFEDAEDMEKVTGLTMKEVTDLASRGSAKAVHAMVWIALRRGNPHLRFSDLKARPMSDVQFSMDADGESPKAEAGADE